MHWASESILRVAWTQSWQIAVLAALVAITARLACRRRPHLAYLLWMLVIVKALTPPFWSSPTSAFSWATMQTSTPLAAKKLEPVPFPTPVMASVQLEQTIAPNAQVAKGSPAVGPPEPVGLMFAFAEVRVFVWMIGTFGLLAILLARWLKLVRVLRRTTQTIDPVLEQQFDALHRQIGPRRRVRLVCTSAPMGPAAFGLWRGSVIVPLSLVRDKTADELAPILAHELIHLRRFDTLAANVQLLAQVLWWFHPAVWWANRQARIERERACDEEVVAELGCRPADYARLLVEILQWRQLSPVLSWPGMRAWDVTSRRLENVLDPTRAFRRRTPAWCFLVLLVCLAIALPGASLRLTAAPAAAKAEKQVANQPSPSPPQPSRVAAGFGMGGMGGGFNNARMFATPDQRPIIDKLEQLGIRVTSSGAVWGGKATMYLDATLPASFRPTGPLPKALLEKLRSVTVGGANFVQSPGQPLPPHPSEERLRQQLLALIELPAGTMLNVHYTADNVGALAALEKIPALDNLQLGSYPAATQPGFLPLPVVVPLPTEVRLDRLRNLRSLGWMPAEADLGQIAALKKLETLNLGNAAEPLLNQLAALTSLKNLTLSRDPFDQKYVALDLACLEGTRSLELLSVFGTLTISDAAAERIGRLAHLKQLTSSITTLGDAGLTGLARAKNLQELTLMGSSDKLTSGGLAALGSLVSLRSLVCYFEVVPPYKPITVIDQSLAGWENLKQLQTLRLDSCRIGDAGLRVIGQLATLEKLQLVGQLEITDAGLAPLANLKNLQALVLHESRIDGDGLSALAGLDKLRLLSLANTPITGHGLAEIAKLPGLRSLDISGNRINDEQFELTKDAWPEMKRLNVAHTPLSDKGFASLLARKNLRQLNAVNTKLTAMFLAQLLKANPELWVWIVEGSEPQSKIGASGIFQSIDIDSMND